MTDSEHKAKLRAQHRRYVDAADALKDELGPLARRPPRLPRLGMFGRKGGECPQGAP